MTSVFSASYSLSSSPSAPSFHPTHALSTNSSASSIGRPSTSASTNTGSYTSPPTTPSPGTTTASQLDSAASHQSYLDFVATWSDVHISRWLAENRLASLAPTFRDNDIRGSVILDLDMFALKEMGINSVGERVKIMAAVKQLRKACSATSGSSISSHTPRVPSTGGMSSSSTTSTETRTGTSPPQSQPLLRPPPTNGSLPRRPATSPASSPSTAIRPLPYTPAETTRRSGARSGGRPPPLDLSQTTTTSLSLPQVIDVPPSSAISLSSSPMPTIITPRAAPPLHPPPVPAAVTNSLNSSGRSSSGGSTGGFIRHEKDTSGSGRTGIPPMPPPPKSQALPLPPAPHTLRNMPSAPIMHNVPPRDGSLRPQRSHTPLPSELPYNNVAAASSGTALGNNPASSSGRTEYGLPRGPGDMKRGFSGPSLPANPRSNSPLPPQPPQREASLRRAHERTGSLKVNPIQTTVTRANVPSRPATSGSAGGPTTRHPYAAGGSSVGSSLQLPVFPNNSRPDLSPITESSPSSSIPSAMTPGSIYSTSTYSKSPNTGRPMTPSTAPHGHVMHQPSLQDLRRRLVKFLDAENGHSCKLNVEQWDSGVEVLEQVLKKFNKASKSTIEEKDGTDGSTDGALSVDGYALYRQSPTKPDTPGDKPLTEAELLAICSSPNHPAREHGIYLKQVTSTQHASAQAAKLAHFFGESVTSVQGAQTSPTSPTYVIGPRGLDSNGEFNTLVPPYGVGTPKTSKQLKRASTISVMSGLGGVPDLHGVPRSPSNTSFLSSPKSKITSFFTRRPPSELITNNLKEYFPDIEKKNLSRAARHSIMRKNHQRLSSSRFSISSNDSGMRYPRGSPAASLNSSPLPPPAGPRAQRLSVMPPRPSFESSPRISIEDTDTEESDAPSETPDTAITQHELLPPVPLVSDSLASLLNLTSTASSTLNLNSPPMHGVELQRTASQRRMSSIFNQIEEMRAKRDKSDTASIITVDEITKRVESRRHSTLNLAATLGTPAAVEEIPAVDEDSQYVVVPSAKPVVGLSPAYEEEAEELPEELPEEEEEDLEEDEDEDALGNEADADEGEPGKPQTSQGGKKNIRWIKGALIGAGSFGSVYLGMDASTGTLMAVKQVELPTGTTSNEERKKAMLNALEREIELLKTLQHENIVQYVDSSSDEKYLNIFLEYVPGGSVAALLRSYGAFEEPLVGNFVGQILTGLNYLHERDIIHRDIKGANILVDNKGGVKISDFGISKKVQDNFGGARSHRPSLQGSVFWMAPEVAMQKAGAYTRKADIWSIGCLVLEMLTGQRPWAELDQMQAMWKIGTKVKPTFPSDISANAIDFLNKTLDPDPNNRPSAMELLQHVFVTGPK
ncbi:Pkinase-domain-containing protein [Calocera viscosa TUFC12733]|uniref:Pkinase-domain-containing protein n=1 Tax=Calocera viscosa (strain TUFC12733) TaxID=1330018 RepID=A0A167LMS8_CALVF|nr:Pkinase-domain-containing protein [Calocera viscosa TUFC12733]